MFALDLSRGLLNSSCVPLSACAPWSDGYGKSQNREAQAGISLKQQVSLICFGSPCQNTLEPECP